MPEPASQPRAASSVAEVVESGLCIGCGLCEAIAPGSVMMKLADVGAMRPMPVDGFTPVQEALVLSACPGVIAVPRVDADSRAETDVVWGEVTSVAIGWAGDPDVRFRAATGGVLTGLALHLLESGEVDAILHIAPGPGGLESQWTLSTTAADVNAASGSRYGPTSPLAGLSVVLDRGRPFAVVAKPCDLGAIHAYAQTDERVDKLCLYRLTMVCGGQSRISKTLGLVSDFGVEPNDVASVRYRGFGNPGRTRIETRDGRAYETTYNELWADESSWDLDGRCTVCVDALGEAADIAALDLWPGGSPTGEDAGFNGIVVRTRAGERLLAAAMVSGAIEVGPMPGYDGVDLATLNTMQPHQVRKKIALQARLSGRAAAGLPVISAPDLRLAELEALGSPDDAHFEAEGTHDRVRAGRYSETSVRLQPTIRTVTVRGAHLSWRRGGTGRTVIWGHGLTGSMAGEEQFSLVDHARLAGTFDLIRYDARGHGSSTSTPDLAGYTWDQMALDQLGLADAFGVGGYVAAGASLGAATAIEAALAAPDRVSGLVLVIPPTAWETRAEQAGRYEQMASIAERRGVEPLVAGLDAAPIPDPLAGDAERRARSEANLRSWDIDRLATVFRGAGGADLPSRESIATISAPTLILAWTGDSGHPVSTANQLVDLMPNAELFVASTAADLATWTDRVVTFVSSLPPGAENRRHGDGVVGREQW